MDYFISSENAESFGAEEHYSDGLSSRHRFDIPTDYNLYVCPQTLFKFHPDFDGILASILHKDRRGLLVLIEGNHPNWAKLLLERFARVFPSAVDRVRFLPQMPTLDFLSLLTLADVLLDTIHFCGGNTSLEAFAFGLPVVTLPGKFLRGRLTFAFYQQMGVMDCVAENAESYVNIALKLANDTNWRNEIRSKISARADVLYEDMEAVHELERFFERAVMD
jgi:predicted O-linked N-acetylglucosamine transferase (SPINDLY family)